MIEKVIYFNGKKYRIHSKFRNYYWCTSSSKNSLHRDIWIAHFGDIPEGFHIHHKDGNKFNNDIENLECIDGREHLRIHMKERVKNNRDWFKKWNVAGIEKAKDWHKSDEGIEWHRQNAKNNNFGNKTYGKAHCLYCYTTFIKATAFALFCSNKCKSAQRRKDLKDHISITCVICGVVRQVNKYNRNKSNMCKTCAYKHYSKKL